MSRMTSQNGAKIASRISAQWIVAEYKTIFYHRRGVRMIILTTATLSPFFSQLEKKTLKKKQKKQKNFLHPDKTETH